MKKSISVIILAGGRATRLGGVDKGLVEYRGKPVIEHVVTKIQAQVSDIVISANRNIARYQHYADQVIADKTAEYLGPLSGLQQCLPACQNETILVVTCDMPLLPDNLLAYFDLHSRYDIQVINIDGRRQLCWLMTSRLTSDLDAYVQQGGKRVMQWLDRCQVKDIIIPQADYPAFKNFNTPESFT